MPWEGVCSPTVCPPGVGGLPGPEGVVCISPPQAYPPNPPAVGRWGGTPCPGTGMGDVCVPPLQPPVLYPGRGEAACSSFSTGKEPSPAVEGVGGGQGIPSPGLPPLLLTLGLAFPLQQGQELSVRAFSPACSAEMDVGCWQPLPKLVPLYRKPHWFIPPSVAFIFGEGDL